MMAGGAARRVSLDDLMREFGRWFWFGRAKMHDHVAHTAMRLDPSERGLTCVITDDLAELADALEQDQIGSEDGAPDPPDSG